MKQLRAEQGLSQREMAEKAGIPQTTLSSYESRADFPNESILRTLSDAMGVSWLVLVGVEDPPHAPPPPIAEVERLGWRGRSTDLSADHGQPWFSYTYEGATESVNATGVSEAEARYYAALIALEHPEYLLLPTEPAERND